MIDLPLKSRHILSPKRLEEEILKANEQSRDDIEGFVKHIHRLVLYVAVLFALIVCLSVFSAAQD